MRPEYFSWPCVVRRQALGQSTREECGDRDHPVQRCLIDFEKIFQKSLFASAVVIYLLCGLLSIPVLAAAQTDGVSRPAGQVRYLWAAVARFTVQ
jgi:hypothetical protein